MKLVHFQDASGRRGHGALQSDGSVRLLAGDSFGPRVLTQETVRPARLLAPIAPPNILAIGLNYRKHAEEAGMATPDRPMLFIKSTNTVQNPGDPIELPAVARSSEVDYEGELAVVIGRACKNATRDNALDHVLGYTCANDVSARDWQKKWGGGQFCQGKSFDTFCPLGPVLVTPDEIPDPHALLLRTHLNGRVVQESRTSDMVFDVPALIAFLSADKTLLPGTVILTGTPHGVGSAHRPPLFLKSGDSVTIEIEGIGSLTNPVR